MISNKFAAAHVLHRVMLVCCLLWSSVADLSLITYHLSLCPVAAQNMHRYSLGFTVNYTSPLTSQSLSKNYADTIPIEFENHRIIVPVEIEGKKYRFLFDTGATQGALFTSGKIPVLREVGNVISYDINRHSDSLRVVQLPAIRMGHLTIDGYLCVVLSSGPMSRAYDGVIGFDLVNKGLCCKIDTENKRLILTDQKKFFAEEQGYKVKYKLRNFVPCVWVSPFMRHYDQVIFDTGFQNLYAMGRKSFQTHIYKSRHVAAQVEGKAVGQHTIGVHGVENADTIYFLALDRMNLGDFTFRDVHIITQEGSSHIGSELFDYGTLIINPFKKRLLFQPHNKSGVVTVANEQFQMAVVPYQNLPMIGLIRENSDAYARGLRRGDIILKVDGHDIPSMAVFQQYAFVKGETYTYTVQTKEGKIKTVQVTR